MIASFRDGWLERFFIDDQRTRNIPANLNKSLHRKLQMIDDATTESDLRVPPSNHFEKLQGKLEKYRSIRVNDRYRLIFQWQGTTGEASDVYLDDHTYR